MALVFDKHREQRVLVLAPLFEEANKFRHQIYETMKLLDQAEVDSFLPDLPGCNESLAPHAEQTLAGWRQAASAAARHFRATHFLSIRSGAWFAPDELPGWLFAPPKPSQVLRGLVRTRLVAAREAGASMTSADILATARQDGITIAGWHLGPALVRELEAETWQASEGQELVGQADVGGTSIWLRSENDYDPEQARALATIVAGKALSE
ncbi:hypothetical protein [Qipengyuania sp. RANM35]|uniref:hypothetical protein n=1 Tax=Qipengyuania sp. RANM35 TaxID=3068635 RepID=UPI0034DAE92E